MSVGARQPAFAVLTLISRPQILGKNLTYFPTNMNDYGSMGMEIREAPCNSTYPVTGTLRAYDWSTSNRKRLQLFGADIASKCLWLVVKAYYTPGNSVTVHNAYYYTSGN